MTMQDIPLEHSRTAGLHGPVRIMEGTTGGRNQKHDAPTEGWQRFGGLFSFLWSADLDDDSTPSSTPAERVIQTSDRFLRVLLRFWLGFHTLFLLYTWEWMPSSLYVPCITIVSGSASALAIDRGYKAAARWLFILPMAATLMIAPFLVNGIRTPVLFHMPLVLVMAGWMLGRRALALMSLAFFLLLIALWQAEALGLWSLQVPLRDPDTWFLVELVGSLSCSAIMIALLGNYQADYHREAHLQGRLSSVLRFTEEVMFQSPLPMRVFNSEGRCVSVNKAYARLVDVSVEQLLTANYRDLPVWRDAGAIDDCDMALSTGKPFDKDIMMRSAEGQEFWLHVYFRPFDLEGQRHLLVQVVDLTEKQLLTAELEALAFRDGLTGLANRRLFLDHLDRSVDEDRRAGSWAAVLMLDLNNFKDLNDTHGHEVGDQLLIAMARRIEEELRATDIAARLGGDEFTVLLTPLGETEREAAEQVARFVARLRKRLDGPYDLSGISCTIRTSIGHALMSGQGAADARAALKLADARMYAEKRRQGTELSAPGP